MIWPRKQQLHFYSQNLEDYFLYRYFLNKFVDDGVYVELGAQDGLQNSNTLFFEKTLGYKGLLIEPAPNQFSSLIRNRGNNFCENFAVDIVIGEQMFIGNDGCSGLVHTMADSHRNRWHQNRTEYQVKTVPMKDLLKKHKIAYIDFLSIDVEGGEELVLKTMDWEVPVYIICIELDNQNAHKDTKCRQILIGKGFEYLVRMNNNEFYINNAYFRREILYDTTKPRGPIDLNNTDEKMHHPNYSSWDTKHNFKQILADFENSALATHQPPQQKL